ncbi:MAG: MerC domain-containing protein [Bacteroidia bacterium]|jgi:hypothetical protein|nr:MerC domain-containing protein [Bacteroidia bacterium]
MKVNSTTVERIGIIGMLLTAIASPCCFPLFGVILSALGFGTFELFGGWTMIVFFTLVALSILGAVFSFLVHKKGIPLIIAILSGALIVYNYFFDNENNNTMYIGMVGLMITSLINYYETKIFNLVKNKSVTLKSIITCPDCGHRKEETMPTDACQFFYECEKCKTLLKPKQGDCCVYCSYGTNPCPPIQETGKSCCN